MRLLLRFLSKLLLGLVLVVGLFALLIYAGSRPPRDSDFPTGRVSHISDAELQALLRDVYHADTSRFIQPDLLWVTFHPGVDVQSSCEAIARVWSHRSGLPWVRVESWRGSTRLAQATARAE